MPKSLEEQIGGKCAHFNGLMNKKCDAGISYESVIDDTKKFPERFPCFKEGAGISCAARRFFTPDEVAARIEEIRESTNKTLKAVSAAKLDAAAKGLGRNSGGQSSLKCPCCEEGLLSYRVAAVNGHMHAKCSTEGCVSWME